ncbi:MAG: DUF3108 domain-containing protein [Elusimicrobiales bacterium]|nr:DUF3108 domain-containing protein [Elusimicrobiales bacterium]
MAFKVLLLLLLCRPAGAADKDLLAHPFWGLPASTAAVTSTLPGLVVGETLEYDISWGAIHVGKAYLRIAEAVDISSRPAWRIVSEAKSGSFINNFYKVDDRNESWMDTQDLHSYGYYKKISEGSHFFNEWVVFDNPAGKYYGSKMNRKRHVSSFEGVLDKPVNDVLSAVYRLRAMTLEPGKSIEMDVNTKKNWRLNIKAGKREKMKTDFGKKQCILFEPKVGDEGLFVAKAGRRMLVWITDDDLKLPMVLKAEIFIGSITARLVRRTIETP